MLIFGINPVREAIRSEKYFPQKLALASAKKDKKGQLDWVVRAAGERAEVNWVEAKELDKLAGGGNHQGVCATIPDFSYESDPLPESARERPRRVVLLDGVTDPQNLGAACRCLVAFGADLLILSKDRSARVNPTVVRASSGAALHARIAMVGNLNRSLERLQDNGFTVIGLDGNADQTLSDVGPLGDLVLCVGSEGKGLRRSIKEHCTKVLRLPTDPSFPQLNASVALAVALYAFSR